MVKDPFGDVQFPSGIGFENPTPESEEARALARWNQIASIAKYHAFSDVDFIRAFIAAVPDAAEQQKYVDHTIRFLENGAPLAARTLKKLCIDPQYVLFFRRSLPSEKPKYEGHWTSDYATARRGLQHEIPAIHRLHTIILASTLSDVLSDATVEDSVGSDGEIKLRQQKMYNQKRSICRFRPMSQQKELEEYLKNPDALSLEQMTEKVREAILNRIHKNGTDA